MIIHQRTFASREPVEEASGEPAEAIGEPTEASGEPVEEASGEPAEASGECDLELWLILADLIESVVHYLARRLRIKFVHW